MGVVVDDESVIDVLASEALKQKVTIKVLVELDVGQKRCGIDIGTSEGEQLLARMAKQVMNHQGEDAGLVFAGLQAYHGGI